MPPKMHSKTRPNSGALSLKTLSAAVVSALIFSNATAAGLGKLTVLSSLGQPLRAEIELTSVAKDEAGALVAKLASAEAFRQANIEFNPALLSLRFAIEQRADRQLIRVTSAQPLNEPFVDMLLELGGPSGRLVREYTFLLDPPDLRTSQSAQVAPVAVPAIPATRSLQSSAPSDSQAAPVRRQAPVPVASGRRDPAPVTNGTAGEYEVKAGDTLARIAGQLNPGGVSLDQMLVALYRENPDAFIGNNMNRLRAGEILSVPSADAVRGIPVGEARNLVVAQSADFNSYRNKLASQVASTAKQKSVESGQTAAGKIIARIDEPSTPAGDSKDKLKLSNAGKATAAPAAGGSTVSAEELVARDKAIAEANARVKELEKNLSDMQKLLELKNKSLAEQQKQAETAKPDANAPVPPIAAVAPSQAAATAPAQPAPATAAAEKPVDAVAPATQAVTPPTSATPAAESPINEKPPVVVQKPQVPPTPAPEPSFVDDLLENPMTLPGVGLLLAALGALGIYGVRRRKQQKQFEDSIITDSSLKANSLFGSTGGQSVDTNNSVFNSNFAPSTSHLDTNEVDPVAEADVYIAYGRDAQAEEILKEALRTQPDRNAVRLKLLEIYSNRKDLRAFEVLATELYGMTKGDGNDWIQAATLGVAIDPNNPLYAAGKPAKDNDSSSMVAPMQPLDEEGLATLLASTQPESQLDSIHALEADSAYFNNSAMEIDKTVELPSMRHSDKSPNADMRTDAAAAPEAPAKPASNELDFDLDGMSFGDVAVPNTITPPAPAEPSADMASIDFDFLDVPRASDESPVSHAAEPVDQPSIASSSSDDAPTLPDMTFDLGQPAAPAQPMTMDFDTPAPEQARDEMVAAAPELPVGTAETHESSSSDPLDFDLSGISLDLKPQGSDSMPDLMFDADEVGPADGVSASDAEMATKLDLAIAYQEIGDKEGARELLDEVMKGGTSEQSEKAKSLLLELA